MDANSADIRIREVKPLLRTKRKFKAQDEINKSVSELTFEEMRGPIQTDRHALGWNHFAKWSESCSAIRAELIIRERRREMERERVTKAVQQSQQGRWTMWEDVVQRSISWNEIWKMSPYRLASVIRSIYHQLPSRNNFRRWGLTEDCKCELCGESETLHHVLSNCKYALDNGRYTWQHNKVLKEVVEATKVAVARANSRKIILQQKVYFLRGGFSLPCTKHKLPSRSDILAEANDWTVAADLEGLRHYPQLLRDSGRRPDVVLASSSSDAFILVELTVPWEDRIEASNVLKTEKYSGLAKDLEGSGFRVKLMAVEVGVRGLVGKSAYKFLTQIGLSSRERTKAMTKMSEVAEAASCWIWEMRGRKRC